MLGRFKRNVILLVLVLLTLAVAAHVFVRLSPAYSNAVTTYERQHSSTLDRDISLCFFCAKGLSYGNGIWHYRFTLIVEKGSLNQRVRVHSQSQTDSDKYVVTLE